MTRWLGPLALIAVVLGALVLVSAPSPQQAAATPAPSDRAFLLMLGEKASADENWDGTVRIAGGGSVTSITGWHFSATDKVTAPNAWTCRTRRDEIPPFADFDYTEMAPGETPKVLYQPVGLYITVSGPPESSVQVQTAQGNFEFTLASLRLSRPSFSTAALECAKSRQFRS